MRYRFGGAFVFLLLCSVAVAFAGMPARYHDFAHIGDGGGLRTTFLVLNQSQRDTANITLEFYDDDGEPWSLAVNGRTGPVYSAAIPPGGSLKLTTAGEAAEAHGGWARLTATGEVGAQVLFEIRSGGQLVTQAAVQSSGPLHSADLFVERAAGTNTGEALASLSRSGQIRVSMSLFDGTGTQLGTEAVSLGPLMHKAKFLTELFPEVTAVRGTLKLSASGPIAVTTLQQTGLVLGTLSPVRRVFSKDTGGGQ